MNNPNKHFSDEILNAYIDGELGPEDTARIDAARETDDILDRRVSDLRKISNLVRSAFQEAPLPLGQTARAQNRHLPRFAWRIAAMVAFIGLGTLIGWHLYGHHMDDQQRRAMLITGVVTPGVDTAGAAEVQGAVKVMFHIGRNDAELFDKVLSETDRLLSNQRDPDQPISIRVIASHGGLSLFKVDLEENARRVRQMKLKYPEHVDFVGCGETYRQWQKKDAGQTPGLPPEMVMVDSGVMELLRGQQRGWTFLSI